MSKPEESNWKFFPKGLPVGCGIEIVEKAKDALHLEMEIPAPFEQEDPELGRLIVQLTEAWEATAPGSVKRKSLVSIFNQLSQITKEEQHIPQVGRNDPCPCGSGQKFKKCCLSKR